MKDERLNLAIYSASDLTNMVPKATAFGVKYFLMLPLLIVLLLLTAYTAFTILSPNSWIVAVLILGFIGILIIGFEYFISINELSLLRTDFINWILICAGTFMLLIILLFDVGRWTVTLSSSNISESLVREVKTTTETIETDIRKKIETKRSQVAEKLAALNEAVQIEENAGKDPSVENRLLTYGVNFQFSGKHGRRSKYEVIRAIRDRFEQVDSKNATTDLEADLTKLERLDKQMSEISSNGLASDNFDKLIDQRGQIVASLKAIADKYGIAVEINIPKPKSLFLRALDTATDFSNPTVVIYWLMALFFGLGGPWGGLLVQASTIKREIARKNIYKNSSISTILPNVINGMVAQELQNKKVNVPMDFNGEIKSLIQTHIDSINVEVKNLVNTAIRKHSEALLQTIDEPSSPAAAE